MEEVSKCKTCGQLDTIYHTSDCGYCTECYAVEDYEYVMIDEITGTEIDEMGEHYESN